MQRRLSQRRLSSLSTRRRLSTLSRVAVDDTTAMIVGRPYWRYPLAVAKPEPSMRPLIEASPFRSRGPSLKQRALIDASPLP